MSAFFGRPHERRERHAGVLLGLFDHVHQPLRQQVNDERPVGRPRGRCCRRRVTTVYLRLWQRLRRTIRGGAPVRHSVHPESAFGPQHRLANFTDRRIADLADVGGGYFVVRELILFDGHRRRFDRTDRRRRRRRRRISGGRIGRLIVTAAVLGGRRLCGVREPATRLFAPVRRRVQAVTGRLGPDVHHRHPRHVHVLLDAHAQYGAHARGSARRRHVVQVVYAGRVVYVLLTVLRLIFAEVSLVSDVNVLRITNMMS